MPYNYKFARRIQGCAVYHFKQSRSTINRGISLDIWAKRVIFSTEVCVFVVTPHTVCRGKIEPSLIVYLRRGHFDRDSKLWDRCASALPACDGAEKKPAATQKSGKKAAKKMGKKKKKDATAATATATAALTPQEAALELDRCLGEIRCIEDSSLSPEEKETAVRKLLPKAAPIAAAAQQAGGYDALQSLRSEYLDKLSNEVTQEIQKRKIHPRQLKPDMLSAEWQAYWNTWTATCERYRLDPNRMTPTAPSELADAFISACGGTPQKQ